MNRKVLRLLSCTRFRIFAIAVIFASVFTVVLCINTIGVNAEQTSQADIIYRSVRVEYGDTLTSIAREADSLTYISIEDHVEAIKANNHLTDDDITAGTYLIVPYYVAR